MLGPHGLMHLLYPAQISKLFRIHGPNFSPALVRKKAFPLAMEVADRLYCRKNGLLLGETLRLVGNHGSRTVTDAELGSLQPVVPQTSITAYHNPPSPSASDLTAWPGIFWFRSTSSSIFNGAASPWSPRPSRIFAARTLAGS